MTFDERVKAVAVSRVHGPTGALPGDRHAALRRLHGPPLLRLRADRPRAERPRDFFAALVGRSSRRRTPARTSALGSSTSIIARSTRRSASLTAAFRKPTPIGAAIERLMVLDAVLGCPDVSRGWPPSATSWRTSPGFCGSRCDKRGHAPPHLRQRRRDDASGTSPTSCRSASLTTAASTSSAIS